MKAYAGVGVTLAEALRGFAEACIRDRRVIADLADLEHEVAESFEGGAVLHRVEAPTHPEEPA